MRDDFDGVGAVPEEDSASDAAYESLLAQTREALQADMDLSPAQWVRVREGVDAKVEGGRGVPWAWVAVAVASASALLISVQSPIAVSPGDELKSAQGQEVAGLVEASAPAAPEVAMIQAGQELSAGSSEQVYDVFGRHRITLEAESALEVLAWSPRELALRLLRGALDADIEKALPGEHIEVQTASASVRVVGTQFRVAVEPSGATEVEVKEGRVAVKKLGVEDGQVTHVDAGNRHRVEIASPAPKPRVRASAERRKKPRAKAKPKEGGFRLIEIDVPPQVAPNAK